MYICIEYYTVVTLKSELPLLVPQVLKEIVHWLTTEEIQVVTEANMFVFLLPGDHACHYANYYISSVFMCFCFNKVKMGKHDWPLSAGARIFIFMMFVFLFFYFLITSR